MLAKTEHDDVVPTLTVYQRFSVESLGEHIGSQIFRQCLGGLGMSGPRFFVPNNPPIVLMTCFARSSNALDE